MDDNELIKVVYNALYKACKFMRDNPPGDITKYDQNLLSCLAGGADDPEGKKFVNYFLNQALADTLTESPK